MVWDRRSRRTTGVSEQKQTIATKGGGRSNGGVGGGNGSAGHMKAWSGESKSPGGAPKTWSDPSVAAAEGPNDVMTVVARVRDARNALGLTGEIVPFGSHVNGFSTANSDCDLSYMPPEGSSTETPIRVLQRFANELHNHGFEGIITIFQALIPLIKAVDPSGIEVDLCVGNLLGHHNSRLVAAYCSLDPRVGEVGKHVKQWAKAWELIGSSDGHLNSYAYTLLTIYHLMHTKPPVVPNLQDLARPPNGGCEKVIVRDRRWGREIEWDCSFWGDVHLIPRSQNTESVESLLRGFFEFYTSSFDWESHAVSIRTALVEGFTPKFDLQGPVQKDQWYVEDPFDLRHNLASQCTRDGRQRILDKMRESLQVLLGMSDNVLSSFASHCVRVPTKFMLKCRVHIEKVTVSEFVNTFSVVRDIQPFLVRFPTAHGARGREVMDAFLVFRREDDRRRAHRLNETYIGEWQLRLLPCSPWAFEDAAAGGSYEELEVTPRAPPPQGDAAERALGDEASEEVRSGLRVAQTPQEVNILIERAQAMSLPHEEQLGRKKLRELQRASEAAAAEEPASEFRFQ
mmetsp:Transcript_76416/g.224190  ORF Transcript_76416/g.224190 Transcript_76416/m.224190 type:complete len:570 (+) Transcript_76416:178-1887(+)